MRKFLLLGVCLAATTGGISAAQADIAVKINGWVGFMGGLFVSRTDTDTLDRDYDFVSNARLQFDIKNVTDSGLEYGARIRMNNVDRKNNVTVDRTYAYVKGGFGTITAGDAPYASVDIGYVYAHDTLNSKLGLGANWGDGLDGKFNLFGGSDTFYAVDPSYGIGGLSGKDTKVKYTSPSFGGLSFAFDFTPVAGGKNAAASGHGTGGGSNDHAGNGGLNDLTDDATTRYENVVTAGLNYATTFDGTSLRLAASAGNGNGVSGNEDYEAYTLGGQVGFANGFAASVNWVHFASTFRAHKAIDSITSDISYATGPFVASVGYAYATAEKGNKLSSSFTNGADLQANHSAILSLLYNVAPGLNTFTELAYERNEFRTGRDYEATTLTSGLAIAF
jgi:hypothetical protein